jgi:hypothetical protein
MARQAFRLALIGLGALACAAGGVRAQEPAQPLPLRDVVLFSSGVGYFQRAGRVNGDAALELSFRAEQVNDILKSLVLFDPGGTVRPVTYTTQDSVGRRLQGLGRHLNSGISLGQLLRQFQGAQVRLETGAEPIEGRIISVSAKQAPVQGAVVTQDVVNVLTAGGLRTVVLDHLREVKLLDERLDRELRESLELLATGLDDQRRRVELRFAGNGAREVRAGYLQEMPVWKTTYRLVLDENQRPYLQGWAVVENTTDEDWTNVRLSLVSGRPVSFIQDLYQPLYVPRPVVQAQVIGSPYPQTYGETLARDEERQAQAPRPAVGGGYGGFGGGLGGGLGGVAGYPLDNSLVLPPERKVHLDLRGTPLRAAIQQLFRNSGEQYAVDPNIPDVPITLNIRDVSLPAALRLILRQAAAQIPGLTQTKDGDVFVIRIRPVLQTPPPAAEEPPPDEVRSGILAAVDLAKLAAQASGTERGDVFEYAIRQPVTLPKGKAAMVPIVSELIEGERVSIYDPSASAKHAVRGFRLKNSTGLHLAGGPITVFQAGVYAGDAQVSQLQPGEDRLISYAVDLDLVADHESPTFKQETVSVSAKGGVLHVTRKQRRENVYTFRNKTAAAKPVLVEQAVDPDFKLVEPAKALETTADEYRFRLEVPAQKTAELKVVTERPVEEKIALLNAHVDLITSWAQNAQASEKLRGALKQLIEHRRRLADLQAEQSTRQAELRAITEEQIRIRQNMAELDRMSDLYLRYVKKLTEQEARIETLRAELAALRERETAAQKEMREFLDRLDAA